MAPRIAGYPCPTDLTVDGTMHVADIVPRIGHEFVKKAETYPGEWGWT